MTLSTKQDDARNPVQTRFALAAFPEWTVRQYRNGMYDAVQGIAISPGFETYAELLAWLREERASHSRKV